MTERSGDIARRASDNRFRRGREALTEALRSLLGPGAPEPVADAGRAAALAGAARAGHRAAAEHAWALVRHEWRTDDRNGVASLVHALGALLGARPAWLVVPGREPQAVAVASDAVLDNPLGFAALAQGGELVLLNGCVPAGLWLGRHTHIHPAPAPVRYTWELEVWGAEPWLSAATRAVRGLRAGPPGA
jgi:hypothetical protein